MEKLIERLRLRFKPKERMTFEEFAVEAVIKTPILPIGHKMEWRGAPMEGKE